MCITVLFLNIGHNLNLFCFRPLKTRRHESFVVMSAMVMDVSVSLKRSYIDLIARPLLKTLIKEFQQTTTSHLLQFP